MKKKKFKKVLNADIDNLEEFITDVMVGCETNGEDVAYLEVLMQSLNEFRGGVNKVKNTDLRSKDRGFFDKSNHGGFTL